MKANQGTLRLESSPIGVSGWVWQMLFTKHCACSEKTSRMAPSQKNAATPKYKPPKYDSVRMNGCSLCQTPNDRRSRSGQRRAIEGDSDCHSHRRWAHQNPCHTGLDTSLAVSANAWCLRWLATQVSGRPDPLNTAKK